MPFLLRGQSDTRAYRHCLADDGGVTFCNSLEKGAPIGGVRMSHERHEWMLQRGRAVQVTEAVYDECSAPEAEEGPPCTS